MRGIWLQLQAPGVSEVTILNQPVASAHLVWQTALPDLLKIPRYAFPWTQHALACNLHLELEIGLRTSYSNHTLFTIITMFLLSVLLSVLLLSDIHWSATTGC